VPLKAREGEERAAVRRRHALPALRAVARPTQGGGVPRGVGGKQAKLGVGGGLKPADSADGLALRFRLSEGGGAETDPYADVFGSSQLG